jgi:hypothetical protein
LKENDWNIPVLYFREEFWPHANQGGTDLSAVKIQIPNLRENARFNENRSNKIYYGPD